MKTKTIFSALSLITLIAGCDAPPTGDPTPPEAPASSGEAEVTGAALKVEQATRMLDRDQDAAAAKALLEAALASSALTNEERTGAIVALSRAEEVLGHRERAITLVEDELARDSYTSDRRARRRLRELLLGSGEERRSLMPEVSATPFAELLSQYFPPAEDGEVHVNVILAGGERAVSEQLGTFDVASGYRSAREKACPLCTPHVDMHSSISRGGDFTTIPAERQRLDEALVVLYFDLERHRIPGRYDDLLPMPAAEVEAQLKAGKGFAMAKEREGAPPVILIAAPRTAMLAEVEGALAEATELPVEPLYVPVKPDLRPREIQTVIRGDFYQTARRCYEDLLKRAPEAAGRVVLEMEIDRDGAVDDHRFNVTEGSLDDGTFLRCLDKGVPGLSFPAAPGSTTVRYPLVMTPQ